MKAKLLLISIIMIMMMTFVSCDTECELSTPIQYTIIFQPNGGNGFMKNIKLKTNEEISLPDCSLSAPNGKKFGYWCTNKNGNGKKYLNKEKINNLTKSDNEIITLFAIWVPITYKIAFNRNGGSGEIMESLILQYDETQDLTECSYNKTAYKFGGWATEPEGEIVYKDKQQVKNLTNIDGKTVILYVVWIDKDAHYIEYYSDKKINNQDNPKIFKESEEVAIFDVTTDGYLFDGWFDASTDGNKVKTWNIGEKTTDVFLWARWTPITYKVRFDNNGGIGTMPDQEFTYDEGQKLNASPFTKIGYKLSAWKDPNNKRISLDSTIKNLTLIDGDIITLTAYWNPIIYKIRFNSNGGTGTMPDQNIRYDESTDLSDRIFTSSMDGYKFGGWATEPEGEIVYKNKQPIKNLTSIEGEIINLYAKWIPINYKVRFNSNGGTGTMPDQEFTYDESQDLTANSFTQTDFSFAKWGYLPNGLGTTFKNCQKIKNLTSKDGDIVNLYAIWRDNKNYINANGNIVLNDSECQKTSMVTVLFEPTIFDGSGDAGVFISGRKVKLSPYKIGQYEVTQKLYETIMNTGKDYHIGKGDNYPVYFVNWFHAITFCNKLSLLMGKTPCYSVEGIDDWANLPFGRIEEWNNVEINIKADGYRLPTEAEWECAARGGTQRDVEWYYPYSGSKNSSEVAWFSDSQYKEVGTKKDNRLGIYDMSGNVYEWCWDKSGSPVTKLDEIYKVDGIVTDPLGLDERERNIRGGDREGNSVTVTHRICASPIYSFGFRLVCSITE